jgi:hypothetical protein
MKKILVLLALSFGMLTANAQLSSYVNSATGTAAGTLLSQFTNNIQPTSFLSNWTGQKTNWLASATKVTNALGMAKSVSSLAGFLKPEMFKPGFILANFQSLATKIKTWTAAANLIKNLEGNLKPEAFGTGWSALRTNWLSGIGKLK